MSHHRLALTVIAAAVVLDFVLGWLYSYYERLPLWHGLFCALANAVTDGGDVAPRTGPAYAITAVEYATVVPLFAATYSFFTSGLTAGHVGRAAEDVKAHVTEQVSNGRP